MILEVSASTQQRFMSENYWTPSKTDLCLFLLHMCREILLASSCSVFELIKILQHKDWIYQSGSNGNKDSKIP